MDVGLQDALDGVKVVDLSRLLPGPMCAWYLRGLGARVIKVEDPAGGDWLRHLPPLTEEGTSAWFSAINAGVRSVTADLKAEADRALVEALIAEADVLIEGFRPGVLRRLGLDPARLRARHPGLVIASITGFGQAGPLRDAPGHDLGYIGLAGILSLADAGAGAPKPPPVQIADLAGGALSAALQITAALLRRSRTGAGAWLDVSMTAGALSLIAPVVAEAAVDGPPAPGGAALTGALSTYACYRCADGGFVTVAALEPQFQAALTAALGAPLPEDPAAAAAIFAQAPRDHWVERLGAACVAPALDLRELLQHPLHAGQLRGSGPNRRVAPPFAGPQAWVSAPAPALGEADAALRAMAAAGALAGAWASGAG
ncbi:MAG: CoA transferase [Deltaproteobacteria bacterium]|nr:CoA transferase [Deltaproteobacteria bacterium]